MHDGVAVPPENLVPDRRLGCRTLTLEGEGCEGGLVC